MESKYPGADLMDPEKASRPFERIITSSNPLYTFVDAVNDDKRKGQGLRFQRIPWSGIALNIYQYIR